MIPEYLVTAGPYAFPVFLGLHAVVLFYSMKLTWRVMGWRW